MSEALGEDLAEQLAELTLARDRPLIVSDADEVLFAFMASFEPYLNTRGLVFDWSSFALSGNIRRRSDDQPIDYDEVRVHLREFFASHVEAIDPVPGAAEALARLTARAQVVVLSNLPADQRAARRRALVKHGMDYPLITNTGAKGEAVRAMAAQVAAPVVFIDDIPHHHTSVKRAASDVWRLHFIADRRLAALLGPAKDSHQRADDWTEALAAIETYLDRQGF